MAHFVIDFCLLVLQSLSLTFAVYFQALSRASIWHLVLAVLNVVGYLTQIAETITAFITGAMSLVSFASHFLSCIVPIILTIIGYTPWWIQLTVLAEESVTIATWVKVLQFLVIIFSWGFLISGLLGDQSDSDDIYGRISFLGA